MVQFRTNRAFDLAFVGALSAGLIGAYFNRVAVTDWWFFATHQPSARAQSVADAAGLSPTGRRLLYRGDPQFADAATIDHVCDTERLGCLTEQGQVYVLDDPANPSQTIVTAAHEMLHLAYRRLSQSDQAGLATILNQAINQLNQTSLSEELSGQASETDRLDEAHSILGTEYTSLPADLEDYYRTYFSARSRVVATETAAEAATP